MEFKVSGKISSGTRKGRSRRSWRPRARATAKHKAYALFGSTNGVKRNKIKIEKVEKAQ